jgi:hypothetical protein
MNVDKTLRKSTRWDAMAVKGAGTATIVFGVAVIVLGLFAGGLGPENRDGAVYGPAGLVISLMAGIVLTHVGVGILLKSTTCLILALVATALAGAWQAAIERAFGFGATIGLVAALLTVLIMLGLAFRPMRRLRALAAAEEQERILSRMRVERETSLSEIPVEHRLQSLDSLKEKGFITEEEWSSTRSEILKGI